MWSKKIIGLSLCGYLACTSAFSALEVPVHINSGNPRFPFPQFVEYSYGKGHSLKNLGTDNPEGVVHIEMEQDIRDAYQIFANEWEYDGTVVDGVKYIRGNIGCPYDCREGDGYSMLAAAVMGDKVSFDGLWMRIHDHSRVKEKSYATGAVFCPECDYGDLIIGDQNANCSATDGDNEIVLALYIAWRQWGADSGVKIAGGGTMNYKKELIDVVRGLVAISEQRFGNENPRRVTTGDVGLDGYLKNGTTWSEVTEWGRQNPLNMNGVDYIPEFAGPVNMHTDYSSPAYFREFYELVLSLDLPESTEWEREQYRRCEASCDWMVGNWLQQSAKNLFFGEEATINGAKVTLEPGNQGGRFRSAWRTALNYVWHGNPEYTWNPTTHAVEAGGNTFEKDWCERFSKFMNDPQAWDKSAACTEYGGGPSVTYKGPSTLHWDIMPDGTFPKSEFTFNWVTGVGMPSAIGAQDLDLAGILYRQCNIEWDITTPGDNYLTSVPHYFHGFFRWLGMVIGTGNHIAPGQMVTPKPNMKIYRAIEDSVTYAYTGDQIKYLLSYRNYASVDAEGVVIVENVPKDFVFVSASDGGVYNASDHTITWKIGKVSGVKGSSVTGPALDEATIKATSGEVSYTCKIGPNAFGRYCTTADITCSNGDGWTTNEYPNYSTSTMQRNCVDVIKRALKIEKSADREKVNPGNMVQYKVDFENSSEAGWLDGGRPRVTLAMSNNLDGSQLWLRFRLYNDAIEPYINYGNYRIAYYMYDAGYDCLAGVGDCGNRGWQWNTSIYEGRRSSSDVVNVTHETIVEGTDDNGRWNQRLCIQFAPLLVTSTGHISNYMQPGRIHKGGTFPLRLAGYLNTSNWGTPDFKDDWSWNAKAADAEDGNYHLISPSWQNIDPATGKSIEIPITEYLPSICDKPSDVIENILVEEYDGYAWRRILGTGPMAGREARDVVVIDTLPKGMEFVSFVNECPLEEYKASWDSYQIADGRWVVKWEIPIMQVKQKGSIIYNAMASFPSGKECETDDELTQNVAWILADKNSPLSDTAEVTVTCAKVPEPIIPTTLEKLVDKEVVQIGDEVTYTINYEQTHGAIFDDALAKASDWTLTNATLSGGVLATNQNQVAKFNNSLSKNMYAEFDASIASDQEGEFFVRDDVRVQYKFNEANGLSIKCFEGSREVANATCALKNNPCRWKVNVVDDVIQVWFGKDTSASPAFTAAGLKVKDGYFGFRGVGWGNHQYSNIHVHTDYAYNLSIIDRKPEELSFVSATEGGQLIGDSIVWKFEQGMDKPIPFGTKYSVSWKGTVDACDQVLLNEAYARLLGHSDSEIRAMATSECGASCSIESVTATLASESICEGAETTLAATVKPSTGDYSY
ncbi:MAG: glycosyl hydrolase family 8, partial [Paludibacteraceae bacterium]|nr:glycosyl hydrolase family 8 [Paludibacteraceae bacterium]